LKVWFNLFFHTIKTAKWQELKPLPHHNNKGEMKMFEEFITKEVKVVFMDGDNQKIARGLLTAEDSFMIKIQGKIGTICISKQDIRKLGLKK